MTISQTYAVLCKPSRKPCVTILSRYFEILRIVRWSLDSIRSRRERDGVLKLNHVFVVCMESPRIKHGLSDVYVFLIKRLADYLSGFVCGERVSRNISIDKALSAMSAQSLARRKHSVCALGRPKDTGRRFGSIARF